MEGHLGRMVAGHLVGDLVPSETSAWGSFPIIPAKK